MKTVLLCLTVALTSSIASVVGLTLFAQGSQAAEASRSATGPDAQGALKIVERDRDKFEGAFGHAGSLVTFESKFREPVEGSRTAYKSGAIATRVKVNDIRLDATRNLATGDIMIDGHDRAIFKEEKLALTALAGELDRLFRGGLARMTPQEQLLYDLVLYRAEAPVGHPLPKQRIPDPVIGYEGKTPPPTQSALPTAEQCQKAEASGDLTLLSACQRRDNDGIYYNTCQTKKRAASYDSRSTCFRKYYGIRSGPCTSSCNGRCGPRCVTGTYPPGTGKYTQDCLDHDTCCGRFGDCYRLAEGPDCGDEYREARDDFLRARINCYGRNCG